MTTHAPQQQTHAQVPPPSVLATAGEASELDLLLQKERVRAEQSKFALEPNDFASAERFAEMIVKSGMFTDKEGRPPTVGSIMLRIMTGRTLGIPSAIALQHVYDVFGRTGISAALKRALVMRHPDCEKYEMLESDEKHCVWLVKRKGKTERRVEFKIEDAVRAQLVKKDSNWEKWPRRMMQARASGEAADVDFADACMGMPSVDELVEGLDREPMAAPVGAALASAGGGGPPPRDWAKETAEMASKVGELVAKGETKTARELYNLFAQEAPEAWLEQLKSAYNRAIAEAKTKSAAAAAKPVDKGEAKGAQPTLPVGEYLPPNKRGDSYDGPDQPPAGWKP
jgi:hypothetical protein